MTNHRSECLKGLVNLEGRIAIDLATRWGMVACVPDGEDSTGRTRSRMMTPGEISKRACETAHALLLDMEERGMVTYPDGDYEPSPSQP